MHDHHGYLIQSNHLHPDLLHLNWIALTRVITSWRPSVFYSVISAIGVLIAKI